MSNGDSILSEMQAAGSGGQILSEVPRPQEGPVMHVHAAIYPPYTCIFCKERSK